MSASSSNAPTLWLAPPGRRQQPSHAAVIAEVSVIMNLGRARPGPGPGPGPHSTRAAPTGRRCRPDYRTGPVLSFRARACGGLCRARPGRAAARSGSGDHPAGRWRGQQTGGVRITIRVRPGSARPGVGGEVAGALVVRVSARAVDGKATEAALAAVAEAFGVRRPAVTLVTGASSRTKIVDVVGGDPYVLGRLLAGPPM